MHNKMLGQIGEKYTEKFLVAQNYQIIKNNFYTRFGEIDLIAIDLTSRQKELVFIEVKTRISNSFGEPQEAISFQKRARILKTAFQFLNFDKKWLKPYWRIDLIALKLDRNYKLLELTHLKNIFHGN